ncbi:hypothetical protein ACKWTF_009936 [Chironomus riparius]
MSLLLFLITLIIKSALSINVPTSSYLSYHGSSPNNPFIKKLYSKSLGHYGSFYSPQIHSAKSVLPIPSQMCPAISLQCSKSLYRTLDGTCNNLKNALWGAANNRYGRLLTPRYGDGISAPTLSVTGQQLPNARLISLIIFGENDVPDREFTIANMQWGQVMTHDMSLGAGATQSRKHAIQCCTDDGKLITNGQAPSCFPILIPKNDPAHSQTNTNCMNFVRTQTDRENSCPGTIQNRPAEQLTVVTSYLDLSLVYGNSDQQNRPIRAFTGGRMLVENRAGNEWPPQDVNATAACDVQTPRETCYLGGDVRINQNPGLTTMQILLLREHNRLADNLQIINPQWDDETVFQEARRINIAQYQHISYYEWLPIFLGRENMLKNRLIYQTTLGSFVNDYNPNIDPSVLNSHATAAFRYFHSQIEGRLDLISESRTRVGSLRLSDWFNRPVIVESGDNFDFLSRGMSTQPQETTDINFDVEIKHFLFRRGMPFGADLRAIDIQRNRDHGLASYNDFREFCGIRRASSWDDYLDLISQRDVDNLRSLYVSHEDVDLTVGGSLEAHVNGALAGPTFLCILTEQFYRTRVGDRYFFERGEIDVAFSREQLIEIRKASMARLFCDNGNNIEQMQPSAFLRISTENQVVPCSQISQVDLSQWRESTTINPSYGSNYLSSQNNYPSYAQFNVKK